jgi:CMP-N,N'-diacetyllegionaminic acid synthase
MKVLAVIPARGGSKGVPGKNTKLLGAKPLICHAIECAIGSGVVTKIVVSTDGDEITKIASAYNIEVIKRPLELADDSSNVVTAVEHAYKFLNEEFDVIVLLQPTSPLRTPKDLHNVIKLLQENPQTDGVISVVPMDDVHPARMYNLAANESLVPFLENSETLRRQDLNPVYYRNGCFYVVRTKAFFQQQSFMVENKLAYIMNPEWLVNIDTQRDFKLATLLYEDWKNENINH